MAVGISHAAAWREPGGVDFSNMFIPLNGEHYGSLAQAKQAGAPTINVGLFSNNVISFLIVAFALFIRGGQSYEPAEAQAGGRTRHRTATFTTGGDDSRDQGCARQRAALAALDRPNRRKPHRRLSNDFLLREN